MKTNLILNNNIFYLYYILLLKTKLNINFSKILFELIAIIPHYRKESTICELENKSFRKWTNNENLKTADLLKIDTNYHIFCKTYREIIVFYLPTYRDAFVLLLQWISLCAILLFRHGCPIKVLLGLPYHAKFQVSYIGDILKARQNGFPL